LTDRRRHIFWVFCRAANVISVLTALAGGGYAQTSAGLTDTSSSVSTNRSSAVSTDTSINQSITVLTDSASAPADSAKKAKKNELADTVCYEADFIEYDNDERVLSLIGRAQIRYQNITLQADTIVYTVANDQFQASGKPQLVDGTDTTVGGFMAYNIKTRRGRVSYAFTRFDDTYVTGSNIVKTRDNRLYIEQGDYTTCQNPQHPHYYFYGRHILVVPDDKVVGRPVVMNVGDAPVAVLPYFVMPLRHGRRSGWLTPSWGGSVNRGGYVDNVGYYYAQSDYFDATLSAKIQEFNSFVFNTRGRYNLRYTLDGEVSGRYVVDNRLENTSRQWALDYRHNQLLSPDGRTRLSGYGNLVSASTFNQLYSDHTYELEKQQLDANMSLSHRFDAVNASTNLVWRRNHNLTTDKIAEDMPMFDFRLQNRALLPYKAGGSKSAPAWYNNIYYAYDTKANVRREAYGTDTIKGFIRPGMEHNVNITSSQKILKYLDISPYFNTRASMFYGAIDTLVKDTLNVWDTIVYTVPNMAMDTRAPDYILISAVPDYFINGDGDLDSLYTVTKVSPSPVSKQLIRDTLNTEFNLVRSWNTGINLSTRIYGLFPINAFGITAVRHTLTPTVGYSFSPKHELDRTFYNVGINYTGPRAKAEQLMTFSLSNSFQGKRLAAERRKVNNVNNDNNGINGIISGINNGNGISGGDSIDIDANNVINISSDVIDTNSVINMNNGFVDTSNIVINTSNDVIDTVSAINTNNVNNADSISTAKKDSGKDKNIKREEKFDILTLSMSTAYNMEADTRRWRDLSLSARTSVSIINASFSSSFWFYDEADELTRPTMNSYSVDLTSGRLGASGRFWDGDLLELDLIKAGGSAANSGDAQSWNINFSPSLGYRASRRAPSERFVPSKSFNVSSSANVNLTKSLSVRWNGNYDFSSDKFSHNSFDFRYDMECWEMRFSWRPEKINPGFSFVVNVKKIPDIKWEQSETKTTRVL
jgi:lipopolysaccharide export system protein LptA